MCFLFNDDLWKLNKQFNKKLIFTWIPL